MDISLMCSSRRTSIFIEDELVLNVAGLIGRAAVNPARGKVPVGGSGGRVFAVGRSEWRSDAESRAGAGGELIPACRAGTK